MVFAVNQPVLVPGFAVQSLAVQVVPQPESPARGGPRSARKRLPPLTSDWHVAAVVQLRGLAQRREGFEQFRNAVLVGAATCAGGAAQAKHFTDNELLAEIGGLIHESKPHRLRWTAANSTCQTAEIHASLRAGLIDMRRWPAEDSVPEGPPGVRRNLDR